ncbi:ATP-binding cassette domain-containing protein [Anderseniella sp. Alg231-50]|uniref:ATP-binding cassette domain-containing protein n=1 Tax=Anderseniella sp. Alg231-50 TaxID=1922226 RepID=UPI000D555AF8
MFKTVDLGTRHVGPVSVSVACGECLAIQGASGSGKSLLFRAIADLDPNQGEVYLNEQSREEMPAWEWRRQVAFVPAETGWWADGVRDHFDAGGDLDHLLEAVDLKDAMDWDVNRLSTGERHRLGIIRALQTGPRVLLLDEPTASLDADMTGAVESLIRQQLAKDVCVLLVTHDPEQAGRLADRSMRMAGGRLHTETGETP